MAKVFIRIYLVMLVTIIVVIAANLLLVVTVFKSMEKKDDLRMVQGTFRLLTEDLSTIDENRWEARVNNLSERFDRLVSLESLNELDLTQKELAALPTGQLVSIYEKDIFYQRIKKSDYVLRMQLRLHGTPWFMGEDNRITDLTVTLIAQAINSNNATTQPAAMEKIGTSFGFPVQLVSLHETTLSDSQKKQLEKGGRIVDDARDTVYHLLGDIDRILILGPLDQGQSWLLRMAFYLICSIILVVSGAGALLWVRPLWRDMDRLNYAAEALGKGDFSSRVHLRPQSSLKKVADVFDSMAFRLEALMGAHKDLVNAVAHELRTPITRIRFASELLSETTTVTQGQEPLLIKELDNNLNELDELINEILTYSKFEQVAPHFHVERVPLQPWIDKILSSFAVILKSNGLEIAVHQKIAGAMVTMDSNMMSRALENLLQNAARYARSRIDVTIASVEDAFCILVEDDGPGIQPEEQERIFEPFTRLESPGVEGSASGYGLGLSIVRRIAHWHQGTVTASKSSKGGARLTIQWPKEH